MKMRNRKSIIAIFLVLALMLVGVGYAAIEGSLTIEGTGTSAQQKFNVVFTGATLDELVDSANDNVVPAVSVQNTKLDTSTNKTIAIAELFTVSLTVSGLATTDDYATVTFSIANHNKVDMKLTPVVTGASVFDVTGGFPDTNEDGNLESTVVVPAEGATTYTVTVKLANEIDTASTEKFTITLNGTSTVN